MNELFYSVSYVPVEHEMSIPRSRVYLTRSEWGRRKTGSGSSLRSAKSADIGSGRNGELTLLEHIGYAVHIAQILKLKLLLVKLDILDHLLHTRFTPAYTV